MIKDVLLACKPCISYSYKYEVELFIYIAIPISIACLIGIKPITY